MSSLTNVLKNGWHPDKDKPFKEQVTGLLKRDSNKDTHREARDARPLTSLRDPDSFGAPPKHTAGSSSVERPAGPSRPSPARSGGSYRSKASSEEERSSAPPKPFRVNTTGLSTANLPLPPVRRDGADGRRSPLQRPTGPTAPPPARTDAAATQARSTPPSLPPRLPPRSSPALSASSTGSYAPPPLPPGRTGSGPSRAGDSHPNQGAIDRLSNAGISVPGLGIGNASGTSASRPSAISTISSFAASSGAAASTSPSLPASAPKPSHSANPQLGELQARFSKMNTGTSAISGVVAGKKKPPPPPPPAKKKPGLGAPKPPPATNNDNDDEPPPIPMATRPQRW